MKVLLKRKFHVQNNVDLIREILGKFVLFDN